MRAKYTQEKADEDFARTAAFWKEKLRCLQVSTPNEGMNTELNIWNLYQSEINIMFSRFTSFIEVGGQVGLGYRDTAQDAMMVPHSNPEKCRSRLVELLRARTIPLLGKSVQVTAPRDHSVSRYCRAGRAGVWNFAYRWSADRLLNSCTKPAKPSRSAKQNRLHIRFRPSASCVARKVV